MAWIDYGMGDDGSTNNDPGVLNPGYDGSTGGQGISDPSVRDPTPASADPWANLPSNYGTVRGYYQSLLGRDAENTNVVKDWLNWSQGDMSRLQAGIAASPEAKAYAARGAAPAATTAAGTTSGRPTGGNLTDPNYAASYVAWAGTQPGVNPSVKNDPGYWIGRFTSGAFGNDQEYALQRMMQAEGAPEAAGAAASGAAGSTSGTNPGGYTDPSSVLYMNQLLSRLSQANQPQDNSIMDLLKSLALKRVDSLNAPPYSAADEQALIAKYREPLTQARDAAYQRNKETASAHGYAPSSGLLRYMDTQTNQGYEQGIAQGSNQMAVNAIAQKQANAQQQLSILSSLLSANNNTVDRTNSQADHALDIAKMFPDFDAARLQQLLQAGSDTGASSALGSLTSLGNLNLNTIGMNNANDQAAAEAWGKLYAQLLHAAGG